LVDLEGLVDTVIQLSADSHSNTHFNR
jgi:hypothetical protein